MEGALAYNLNRALLAGIAAATLGAASPALSSTVEVQFWSYDAAPFNGPLTKAAETNPIIATTPTATFFYTGPIDFDTQTVNTVGAFFGANSAGISGFSSTTFATEAAFLASPMSVGGDSQATFFRFTGALSSPGQLSGVITHDDGVSFYLNGATLTSAPDETSVENSSFFAPGPITNAAFILDYFAGNGVPEVLDFAPTTPFSTSVPEASTWLMMIAGFFGLGVLAYRRRSQDSNFRIA
jgi:hypothetical protein